MKLTSSGSHSISRCRGETLPKYQRRLKVLKEKKEVSRNQRVSKRGLLQTLVHSDAEAILTDFLSRKGRKVYGNFSAE